ncbi:hypothetical protein KAU51_03760 [Candidatus Parcubacteria bacterium]|nr:hypothetical protein [Candidatus Parcubacteria bacterium]
MYSYAIFKKSVVFSRQTDHQGQNFETMKLPKTIILECAEKIEHKNPSRNKIMNIWAITHGVVVEGGHWGFTTTYVRAKTDKKALSFFNENMANNYWTQKATIENVKRLIIHKTG